MTTHDQHQEATESTTAPTDFADGQRPTPPPGADRVDDRGPLPPAADTFAADRGRSDDPTRSADPAHAASNEQRLDQSQSQSQPQTQHDAPATATADTLFAEHDLSDLRSRWSDVQATFVDDPRECVQKADRLVSDTVEQLTSSFSHARSRLEEQWSRGEEASTEDLRLALKRYRDFFDRLLAV